MHDPDLCETRGCDELRGHSGEHCRYKGSFTLFDPKRRKMVAVSVTESWTTRADRHHELIVDGAVLMLTRHTERRLARLLTEKAQVGR
jgi:hypothetical protein